MKFETKEDIPRRVWGNPNPRCRTGSSAATCRWTSWLAGAQQWGLSSIRQGESSGTITHEISHTSSGSATTTTTRTSTPYHRVGTGRGTCWTAARSTVPAARTTAGWSRQQGGVDGGRHDAADQDRHGLRARTRRAAASTATGWPQSGLAVADVIARAVNAEPQPTGIRCRHPARPRRRGAGGQGRRPATSTPTRCAPAAGRRPVDELLARDRPADRRGLVEPDSGVLITKNKAYARARRAAPRARLRLQLLRVGDRRPPGGHQHRSTSCKPGRHAGDADDRRLPPAQRRAVPRRDELGLVSTSTWTGQPPALLRARQVHATRAACCPTTSASRTSTGAGPHTRGVARGAADGGAEPAA